MLRQAPVGEDIEIVYLNAAIEDHYSYNAMPDRQAKLQAFDRFLSSVNQKFQPDLLYIACNTLSVLYQDPYFDHHRHIPIEGIVDTGAREMLSLFENESDLAFIVFAAPTTIEEGVYGDILRRHGVPPKQIAEQACPGLPDAISNDGSGVLTVELLKTYVPAALAQFAIPPAKVAAFLGCTHFGYQADRFQSALLDIVPAVQILNPNTSAAETILKLLPAEPGKGDLTIEFVARYVVPDVVINSLSGYIGERAPATLSALKNFTHLPELCGELAC